MKKPTLNQSWLFLISFLIVIIDQLSKSWAIKNLGPNTISELIPNLINFQLTTNTGAAFSLFSGSNEILSLISLIAFIVFIIWLYRTSSLRIWQGLALAFLIGGTAGNGLDRWRLGHVIDFIQLVPISFPIFNVADMSINIALIFLFIDVLTTSNDR